MSAVGQDVILEVNDLRTYIHTRTSVVKAVDGISFNLRRGETLGIVGESGCGKTMTALSLLRLVPKPAGRIERERRDSPVSARGQPLLS